ncbi:MAG: 30S ribosomal protein S17 [Syntrophorhabdaceae bacterium PtaU1.Bin034]|jgi:small subunit ribosomal protein S17|nr:MAG: 30S ribosomal protein S17 [Syntrophorhabdaceae bacterium PtaU1.Bin034]
MERKTGEKKQLVGIVVKDKMDKTVVVEVERMLKHSTYHKYLRTKTTCKAHDEENKARIGDKVLITETRPLSKDKRWVVKEIITKEVAVPEASEVA